MVSPALIVSRHMICRHMIYSNLVFRHLFPPLLAHAAGLRQDLNHIIIRLPPLVEKRILPREAKIEMNHLAGAARRDGHAFYGICAVELRRALALGCYKTAWLLQLRRNLGTGRRPLAA